MNIKWGGVGGMGGSYDGLIALGYDRGHCWPSTRGGVAVRDLDRTVMEFLLEVGAELDIDEYG